MTQNTAGNNPFTPKQNIFSNNNQQRIFKIN